MPLKKKSETKSGAWSKTAGMQKSLDYDTS